MQKEIQEEAAGFAREEQQRENLSSRRSAGHTMGVLSSLPLFSCSLVLQSPGRPTVGVEAEARSSRKREMAEARI